MDDKEFSKPQRLGLAISLIVIMWLAFEIWTFAHIID